MPIERRTVAPAPSGVSCGKEEVSSERGMVAEVLRTTARTFLTTERETCAALIAVSACSAMSGEADGCVKSASEGGCRVRRVRGCGEMKRRERARTSAAQDKERALM